MTNSPVRASITLDDLPEYYDWLSRFAQLVNWLTYRDRFASYTMHKRLAVPGENRRSGIEFVNDHVLEFAGLAPEPRVLDAGCGFGGTVFHWHSRIGGSYHGVTLSPVQHAVAEREARRRGIAADCRFRVRSYDDPVGHGFDAVVAIESLTHSRDLKHTIANMATALRPGGLLVVLDDMAVLDLDNHRPVEAELLRRHWGCARYWMYDDFAGAADSAGLTLLRQDDLSAMLRPHGERTLDRLQRLYAGLHRWIPLRPVRTVVSALLGGIALERLHLHGDVRYRLLVAQKDATCQ